MKYYRILAMPSVAAYLLGAVAVVAFLAPSKSTHVAVLKDCIQREFSDNGFRVSSAGSTNFEGHVAGRQLSGPNLTVVFNANDKAKISLGQTAISLPISHNALGAIQSLTNDISDHCLDSSEPVRSYSPTLR